MKNKKTKVSLFYGSIVYESSKEFLFYEKQFTVRLFNVWIMLYWKPGWLSRLNKNDDSVFYLLIKSKDMKKTLFQKTFTKNKYK